MWCSQLPPPLCLGPVPSSGTGANSDAKRGTKVVSLRAEVSWSRCEWDFNLSVGSHTFPSWGQVAESTLLTVPEGRASSLSGPLLLPSLSLSGVASPFQRPHSLDGAGEEGFCWKKDWVLGRQPAPGKMVRGTLLHKDPARSSWVLWVHPSARCEGGEAEGPEAVQ